MHQAFFGRTDDCETRFLFILSCHMASSDKLVPDVWLFQRCKEMSVD